MNYFIWNPSREAFYIPIVNHPVAWYGVLFAVGFFMGVYLFQLLFYRFLLSRPFFTSSDVNEKELYQSKFSVRNDLNASLNEVNKLLSKGVDCCAVVKDRALRFIEKTLSIHRYQLAENRLILEKAYPEIFKTLRSKTKAFTESLLVYVVIGTILGARLGHIIFYENINDYLQNLSRVFMIWEGGLASHGGILGIILSLVFFYRINKHMIPRFNFVLLIDLLVIPSAIVAFFIRMGNFVNQEIIGKTTSLPWAVIFVDPIDGSLPLPRHPVQLYEALFYLFTFVVLLLIFYKYFERLKVGVLSGLFFLLVFVFRFFIEFLKERQSVLLDDQSFFLMGQYLSIPFIILGLALLVYGFRSKTV